MKIAITAIVDLGDNFCDENCPIELKWAKNCIRKAYTLRLADVDDDYPIVVTSIKHFKDSKNPYK